MRRSPVPNLVFALAAPGRLAACATDYANYRGLRPRGAGPVAIPAGAALVYG